MSISVEMTAATSKRGAAQMRTCKVHGQVAGHAGKEEGGQPVHPGRPLPASIPASITLLASECLLLPAASHTQGSCTRHHCLLSAHTGASRVAGKKITDSQACASGRCSGAVQKGKCLSAFECQDSLEQHLVLVREGE